MGYHSEKDDESLLMERLRTLSVEHPTEGFWKFHFRIRNSGEIINHKRVPRVYKKLGIPLRRKQKKRLPTLVKKPFVVPSTFTHTWSIDFVSDAPESGGKFSTFNVIDDYNREVLFAEADDSLKSSRVIWVVRHLINRHGKPMKIRMDYGPEFIAQIAQKWSERNEIEFKYIEPGKPKQHAFVDRFNGTFRDGVLDAYIFRSLEEVRVITAECVHDYNHFRPHDALGGMSPINYRKANKETHTPPGSRSAPAAPTLHSTQGTEQNRITK